MGLFDGQSMWSKPRLTSFGSLIMAARPAYAKKDKKDKDKKDKKGKKPKPRAGPPCDSPALFGPNCGQTKPRFGHHCGNRVGAPCGNRVGTACHTRTGTPCFGRVGSPCGEPK